MLVLSVPISSDIDQSLCIKYALLHDLAECVVGDITPHDNVSSGDKY